MNLEKIYAKVPVWIQEIMINCYGIKTYLERYGGNYKKYKKEFINKRYISYETEKKNQIMELKKLLKYAKNNVKYYSKILEKVKIEEIESLRVLEKLPILKKEFLKENPENFYSKEGTIPLTTSGTTGSSLKVLFKKDDIRKRMAYWDYFKESHGLKFREKTARFSGKKIIPEKDQRTNKYWRTNKILNQRLYSTHHMSKENLKFYVDDLNKYKPRAIDGYVNCIYELAKYIKENNIKLKFKPIAIFTTAETVLPSRRKVIEEVFLAPIRDMYASSEGAPFITECCEGKMHYRMDTGIIEIKKDTNEMLVTSFTTYGTPLIRYDIGDEIIFSTERCKCGSPHPIVKQIIGRNSDFLYSEERGKIVSTIPGYLPEEMSDCIENCQFIQGNKEKITVLIVPKKKFGIKEIKKVEEFMQNCLGKKIKIEIEFVKQIEKEKSGKTRLIKNSLKF